MILAIETGTPVCSVAISLPGKRALEKRIEGRGVHSEKAFLFIRELLDRQEKSITDLKAVLLSNGPGSYTGLRIGASAVKGLLFKSGVPLFTLGSLHSLAIGASFQSSSMIIHTVIDARRTHLYYQPFSRVTGILKPEHEPEILKIEQIKKRIKNGDVVAGTGVDRLNLDIQMQVKRFGNEIVSAKNLINGYYNNSIKPYFKRTDPEKFEPDYIHSAQVNNS